MTKTKAEKIIESFKSIPFLSQPLINPFTLYSAQSADIEEAQQYAFAATIYWDTNNTNPCRYSNKIIEHWNLLITTTVETLRLYYKSIIALNLQKHKVMITEDYKARLKRIYQQILDLDSLDPFEYERKYRNEDERYETDN